MRDVNNGWVLRYLHANGASFFFIWVYLHIGRNLFYGSYRAPRTLLWNIGVVIYILMMANLLAKIYIFKDFFMDIYHSHIFLAFIQPRFKAIKRIGPHNLDILSILTGSLLGDGHIYRDHNSYRIRFEQGYKHKDYLFWLFRSIKNLGYANSLPKLNESNNRKNFYFYTYTYTSLYFLYNEFYLNGIKK